MTVRLNVFSYSPRLLAIVRLSADTKRAYGASFGSVAVVVNLGPRRLGA